MGFAEPCGFASAGLSADSGAQGMDVDDTYIYNVKIASSTQDNAFISRTHKDTGSTVYLTNAATGTYFFSNFYHANDLEVANINGETNLFVATSLAGSTSLLRFRLSGTTLTQIGSYHTLYNGSDTAISSARVMSVDDEQIHLLIKKGKYLYTADLPISATSGSITMTHAFTLDKDVVLRHDRPWSVEWQATGSFTGGALLMAAAPTSKFPNAPFLFRNSGDTLIALGYHDGTRFHNYGVRLDAHGIDSTLPHTYRLTNRIASDGSNMVYLFVDDLELGPMNGYHVGGSNQGTTGDWVAGQDFTFSYLGTVQHNINADINNLQVWENGRPADHTPGHYRWETDMTAVSGNNPAQILSGSVTVGGFSGAYFQLNQPVVLRHDEVWSIQWSSTGSWKDTANCSLLLSASDVNNDPYAPYLYRRNASHIIAFGERRDGGHQNYGIKLSDHGIDGTAAHTYRITNRIASDGSNMAYLYVDGQELGPMNQHFIGGAAQGVTSDWISGKDFVFNYLGTPDFTIGNCTIEYLQIDEACAHSYGVWSGSNPS